MSAQVNLESPKASYRANVLGLVPASLVTDIFSIAGSASKTIKITRISISGTSGSATTADVQAIKRSTANTGGTSASVPAVPNDANDPAATASLLSYTGNPTLGTVIGAVASAKLVLPVAGNPAQPTIFDFGNRGAKPIILRGTGQTLNINLNSITIVTGSVDLFIEWTEE